MLVVKSAFPAASGYVVASAVYYRLAGFCMLSAMTAKLQAAFHAHILCQ